MNLPTLLTLTLLTLTLTQPTLQHQNLQRTYQHLKDCESACQQDSHCLELSRASQRASCIFKQIVSRCYFSDNYCSHIPDEPFVSNTSLKICEPKFYPKRTYVEGHPDQSKIEFMTKAELAEEGRAMGVLKPRRNLKGLLTLRRNKSRQNKNRFKKSSSSSQIQDNQRIFGINARQNLENDFYMKLCLKNIAKNCLKEINSSLFKGPVPTMLSTGNCLAQCYRGLKQRENNRIKMIYFWNLQWGRFFIYYWKNLIAAYKTRKSIQLQVAYASFSSFVKDFNLNSGLGGSCKINFQQKLNDLVSILPDVQQFMNRKNVMLKRILFKIRTFMNYNTQYNLSVQCLNDQSNNTCTGDSAIYESFGFCYYCTNGTIADPTKSYCRRICPYQEIYDQSKGQCRKCSGAEVWNNIDSTCEPLVCKVNEIAANHECQCKENYFRHTTSSNCVFNCRVKWPNCLQCSNETSCNQCDSGYTFDSSFNGGQCIPDCQNCQRGQCVVQNGQAVCQACLPHYVSSSSSLNVCSQFCGTSCVNDDLSCQIIEGKPVCKECVSLNFKLENGACVSACDSLCQSCLVKDQQVLCNTCPSGYRSNGLGCELDCGQFCSQCSLQGYQAICTSCQNNQLYEINGANDCQLKCTYNCSGSNCRLNQEGTSLQCAQCDTGFELNLNQTQCKLRCSDKCEYGQCYGLVNGSKVCQACKNPALFMPDGTSDCKPKCLPNCSGTNCTIDQELNTLQCTQCDPGYKLSTDGKKCELFCSDKCVPGQCVIRPDNKKACQQCLQPDLYTPQGQDCSVKCLQNCKGDSCQLNTAGDSLECAQCDEGYELSPDKNMCKLFCHEKCVYGQCSLDTKGSRVCSQCEEPLFYEKNGPSCQVKCQEHCSRPHCQLNQLLDGLKCSFCDSGFRPTSQGDCELDCDTLPQCPQGNTCQLLETGQKVCNCKADQVSDNNGQCFTCDSSCTSGICEYDIQQNKAVCQKEKVICNDSNCLECAGGPEQCTLCSNSLQAINGFCVQCPTNCEVNQCTAVGGVAGCAMCKPGFRLVDGKQCWPCSDVNCKSCASNVQICDSCLTPFTLQENSTCRQCASDCQYCNNPTNCTQCKDAQNFTPVLGLCKPRCSQNCLLSGSSTHPCLAPGTCDMCQPGFTVNSQQTCTQCPQTCNQCEFQGPDLKCLQGQCKTGTIFVNGTCEPICPGCVTGQCSYLEGPINNCQKCSPGYASDSNGQCVSCSNLPGCLSCAFNQIQNLNQLVCTQCQNQQTPNPSTGQCQICPEGCSSCQYMDGSIKCSECSLDLGYVIDDQNGQCKQCSGGCNPGSCSYSNGQQICTQCNSAQGFILDSQDGKCRKCDLGCQANSCSFNNGQEICTECLQQQGFVLDQVDGQCRKCDSTCQAGVCSFSKGQHSCSACVTGLGLVLDSADGQCRTCRNNCQQSQCTFQNGMQFCRQCQVPYVADSVTGQCMACSNSIQNCVSNACSYTNGQEQCTACQNGSVLINGACVSCPSNCSLCTSSNQCSSCQYPNLQYLSGPENKCFTPPSFNCIGIEPVTVNSQIQAQCSLPCPDGYEPYIDQGLRKCQVVIQGYNENQIEYYTEPLNPASDSAERPAARAIFQKILADIKTVNTDDSTDITEQELFNCFYGPNGSGQNKCYNFMLSPQSPEYQLFSQIYAKQEISILFPIFSGLFGKFCNNSGLGQLIDCPGITLNSAPPGGDSANLRTCPLGTQALQNQGSLMFTAQAFIDFTDFNSNQVEQRYSFSLELYKCQSEP